MPDKEGNGDEMSIGADAHRAHVHTRHITPIGRSPKREWYACECGASWATESKARKCARTHDLPKVVSRYGFDDASAPSPVSVANRGQ